MIDFICADVLDWAREQKENGSRGGVAMTDDLVLFCGDSKDITPQIADNSIDLIIEDYPYFRVKGEWWDRQWSDKDAFLAWLNDICTERKRILKPNGSYYAFASPQMCHDVVEVIRSHFNVLNVIRWYNDAHTSRRSAIDKLRTFLEPWEAVVFSEQWFCEDYAEDSSSYYSQCKALHKNVYAPIGHYIQSERERAGYTRNEVEVALGYVSTDDPTRGTALCYRWEEGRSLPTREVYLRLREFFNSSNGTQFLRREYEDLRREREDLRQQYEGLRLQYEGLRRPFFADKHRYGNSDLWLYNTASQKQDRHPTEKPIAMIQDIINTSSRPGDTVADFFMGSGTTADAARRLGRKFIGGDIMQKWYEHTRNRLSQGYMF